MGLSKVSWHPPAPAPCTQPPLGDNPGTLSYRDASVSLVQADQDPGAGMPLTVGPEGGFPQWLLSSQEPKSGRLPGGGGHEQHFGYLGAILSQDSPWSSQGLLTSPSSPGSPSSPPDLPLQLPDSTLCLV